MNPRKFDGMPFGDLNASERSDIEQTYVDITDVLSSKYVQINDLAKAKIIVGRKGSGKTHLLKHIHNISSKNSEVCLYVPLRGDIFAGRGIRVFRGDLSPEKTTVFWSDLWRAAFLIAGISIFYCERLSQKASQAIDKVRGDVYLTSSGDNVQDFRLMIEETYPQIAWKFKREIDPIVAIEELAKRYTNLTSFTADFRQRLDLNSLEEDLTRLLHHYGHVHYIIDGMDELAWSDLTGWLDVQRGLFKCAFLLSAVRSTTQYLKTTVSIRNYVYQRSTQDPHGDRTEAHLIKLNWDKLAAEDFLRQRLLASCEGGFAGSDKLKGQRPLAEWLGFQKVQPDTRTEAETVEHYLLRHTRLSPRNIVGVLNRLAAVINQEYEHGRQITPEIFKDTISEMARDVAKRMMITTAEEIVASMPGVEKKLGAKQSHFRTQGDYIINMVAEELEIVISQAGSETMSPSRFSDFLSDLYELTLKNGEDPEEKTLLCRELEGILWRSGLIAYRDPRSRDWKFSWADGEFGFAKPSLAAAEIGFHSALIDLCGLRVTEDAPIF